jgi:nitrogen fixation protein FixH
MITQQIVNSIASKPPRTLWPHAIIAWFVIFAAALAAWITFAVRQNMDLVRPDYYEEEIRFQKQLERLNRTTAIRSEVALRYDAARNEVALRLPAAHCEQSPKGSIQFYRPSDATLDFELPLAIDAAGFQHIDTRELQGGLWKIRVKWSAGTQDYFFEHTAVFVGNEDALSAGASGTN